jgi:ribonuclease PH
MGSQLLLSWSVFVARPDDRDNDQLRPLVLERQANPYAEGSCLIRMGGTLVHCTASVEPGVPGFKKGSGEGWVTAEYAMLPRATLERTSRERNGPGGRTQEIQRLIGRSLRAAMGTMAFGEFTIRIDCDVLQADGGTRTASITGGCVALVDACNWLSQKTGQASPFGRLVSAISVGVIAEEVRLDLSYVEDKDATVDSNIVMLEPAQFVEVQGTGEHGTFNRKQLDTILGLAEAGIARLFLAQRKALGW